MLGYLSHVDTVLADARDWTHDPWSGEIHDGFLWGRGAIDMKSPDRRRGRRRRARSPATAGARPRGELKVFSRRRRGDRRHAGAKWLTEHRPELARCD